MNYSPRWLRRFFSSILIGGQAIASIAKGNINKSDLIDQLMRNRSGDYWHVEIEGLAEGTLYGYKVSIDGQKAAKDHIVLDPCARAITGYSLMPESLWSGF